jgi:hypothetical protein
VKLNFGIKHAAFTLMIRMTMQIKKNRKEEGDVVKINHILMAAVITGILMVSPSVGHAFTIEPSGDPVLGASWTQNWSFTTGSTGFAFAESFLHYLSGDPIDFKDPVADDFSHEGWTADFVKSGYMVMRGTAPSYTLTYGEHYTGDFSWQNLYVDHFCYDEHNTFLFGSRYHWTGFGWYHTPDWDCNPWDDWYCKKRWGVPEPTTILLLGAGLLGLGLLGRRKFKKI